ncbi:MAG: TlpA disulfide reductase family protein [Tenuifilaceae bacterium]|jgi:thiol-disulfide isomerase/thioredoxin|nr:TlpA disulfide reductase family protein [Tenuifilaceae bacterium]
MNYKSLAFVALIALASCSNFGPKEVELSGQINNLDNNYALLISKGVTDTLWLNDDGSFITKFMLEEPTYFTLRAGRIRNTIYLAPGDNLNVLVDITNPTNNPVVEGKCALANNLIWENNQTISELSRGFRDLYQLPLDEFEQELDSIKSMLHGKISGFGVTDKDFVSLEKARIDYHFKSLRYDYPDYFSRISGEEFVAPESFFAFMSDMNFANPKHFSINEYTGLVYKHIQKTYRDELAKDEHKGKSEFERNLMLFGMIDSLVPNQTIKDYYKYTSTSETVKWASLEVAKNVAEYFLANTQTTVYTDIIRKALDKRMLLAPGQPAPEFTLTGIDGNTYSLSDFKGKLVYIDFWATWCGPCKRQLPFLKTMKEAYKGKPIAIIAISLDDDKNAWVKMVTEDKLDGIQLHADRAWLSDVAQQYQVFAIPTFVLIDGEGKIIEYPAPRPSDPETGLLVDKHLKLL